MSLAQDPGQVPILVKKFRKEDIERAIVVTLADLDGFNHPFGFKMKRG